MKYFLCSFNGDRFFFSINFNIIFTITTLTLSLAHFNRYAIKNNLSVIDFRFIYLFVESGMRISKKKEKNNPKQSKTKIKNETEYRKKNSRIYITI